MRSSRQRLVLGLLSVVGCTSTKPMDRAPPPIDARAREDVGTRPQERDVGSARDGAPRISDDARCIAHAPYVETLRLNRSRIRVGERLRATVVAGIDGWDDISLSVDPAAGLRVDELVVDEVETPRGLDEVTVLRWQRYRFTLAAVSAGRYTVKLDGPCFDEVSPQVVTVR